MNRRSLPILFIVLGIGAVLAGFVIIALLTLDGGGGEQLRASNPTSASTPTPSSTRVATPRPTPRPTPVPTRGANITVTSSTSYASSIGTVNIVGEIINDGEGLAANIELAVSLLDAAGGVVGSGSDSLNTLIVLFPGEKRPYKVTISNAPSTWADSRVQTQWTAPTNIDLSFAYTKAIEVSGFTNTRTEFGGLEVKGQATNRDRRQVSFVSILVVGRDEAGQVNFVDEGYTELDSLAPGASSPFTVTIFELPPPEPATISVQGQASPD